MHSELIKIGPVVIYSYGLFVAIGFIIATFVCTNRAKKENIEKEKVLDLNIFVFIAGIIGARLLYVLTELKYYVKDPIAIFKVWEGGLVYYGGFLFGLAGFVWYVKKIKFNIWKMTDILMPGVAIAQCIGRIGCFFRGCCYGIQNKTFGIIFPEAGDNISRIPTQIIESLAAFFIFVVLMNKKKKFDGEIFINYLFYYGGFRFLIEFIRGDNRGPLLFSVISVSQFISIILIITGMFLYKKLKKSGN